MALAALTISLLALGFTIASFWWLHAREGSLAASSPQSYAFHRGVRLRLPLVIFNDGAKALIVDDLRVVLDGHSAAREPLPWATTRKTLRPGNDDVEDFPTPFAVEGRNTKELIAEFGDDLGWSPAPASTHSVCLEARIHGVEGWVGLVAFDWWAPPSQAVMGSYVAHRNGPAG